MSMPPKQRAELLGGNWNFDASRGIYFKRDWVEVVDHSQIANLKFKKIVRAWDTASSPPSQTNKNPDWTVGVKMGLTEEGYIYILDVVRFRDTIGKVKEEMLCTAVKDGKSVPIVVPLDPGGHGKHAFQDHVKNLSGYIVRKARPRNQNLKGSFHSHLRQNMDGLRLLKQNGIHPCSMSLRRLSVTEREKTIRLMLRLMLTGSLTQVYIFQQTSP